MLDFTKSQKIRISLTVIWAVIMALVSGVFSQGNFGPFLGIFVFLNMPTLLYWLGFWVWGDGYLFRLVSWPYKKIYGNKKEGQESSVGQKILAGFLAALVFMLVASLINVAEEASQYIFRSFSERALRNMEALISIVIFALGVVATMKTYRSIAKSAKKHSKSKEKETQVEISKKQKIVSYLIMALGIFFALTMIFISANEQQISLGYLFGEVIGASILFGVLVMLITPSKWTKVYQASILSVVFLMASIFIAYPQYKQAKIDKKAFLEMARTVEKDTVNYMSSNSDQELTVSKIEVPASSSIAPIMDVVNLGRKNGAKIFSDYTSSFPENFENILTQETFEDKEKIEKAKLALIDLRLEIPYYKRRIRDHFDQLERDMRNVDAEPYIKNSALQGFLKNKDDSKEFFGRFFIIQENILNDYLSLFSLMEEAFGTYQYDKKGQVLFIHDEHIEKYNNIIESIQENALQEEEWNAAAVQKELEMVNKIKSIYDE